jgi:DMSO reductase anchor subunit
MNIFFLIVIAIIGASVVNILYKLLRSQFLKLTTQVSIVMLQYKIEKIKEQITEIEKYKKNDALFTKVILKEVLWIFWTIIITCIAIAIYSLFHGETNRLFSYHSSDSSSYYLAYFQNPSITLILALQSVSLFFFWRYLFKSFNRLLIYYRLTKDIAEGDKFILQKTSEKKHLEQSMKALWQSYIKLL